MDCPNHSTSRVPSLLWVLPLACGVWLGLIVDIWFGQADDRNHILDAGGSVLEGMAVPALILILLWMVCTPARWGVKTRVIGTLFATSFPIAYLAFQRPGKPLPTIWEPVHYFAARVYFPGSVDLSWLDVLLIALVTLSVLIVLNRWLVRLWFHRAPIESRKSGKTYRHRLLEAYFSATPAEDSVSAAKKRRDEHFLLAALILVIVALGTWYANSENGSKFQSLVYIGTGVGLATFLCVWVAAQLCNRWWAFLILLMGTSALAAFAQLTRFAATVGFIASPPEQLVSGTAFLLSTACLAISLLMLTLSHQMPRRSRRSTNMGSNKASIIPEPLRSPSRRLLWLSGVLVWLGFLGLAYWVPSNIDALELTDEDEFSIRDGWLAAQLMKNMDGTRGDFKIGRDPILKKTVVNLTLPNIGGTWRPSVLLIEQRAIAGDVCSLRVSEPITHLAYLQKLLAQGIDVHCQVEGQRQTLPAALITDMKLKITNVFNAKLSAEDWNNLWGFHGSLTSLNDCQLPDQLPDYVITRPSLVSLINCEVPDKLFNEICSRQNAAAKFVLTNPRFKQPIDCKRLIQFLFYGGRFGAPPPLQIPVAEGFPKLFVPVYQTPDYSKWSISVRPMLLNSQIMEEVLAIRRTIAPHIIFDDQGRLTDLGITPTRDCPADRPWMTFPDVEHLFVSLNPDFYDSRTDPAQSLVKEEIIFRPEAFPKLSRVSIHSGWDGFQIVQPEMRWDSCYDKFLCELYSHPQIAEVGIHLPCDDRVWDILAKCGHIERLVLYDRHQVGLGDDTEGSSWSAALGQMSQLQEVIVYDRATWDLIASMYQRYQLQAGRDKIAAAQRRGVDQRRLQMAQFAGGFPAANLSPEEAAEENEKLAKEHREAEVALEEIWKELIQRHAPNVKVKVLEPRPFGFKLP